MPFPDEPYEVPLSQVHWDGPDLILGQLKLTNAKLESFHFSATEGKQVVQEQWSGLSEGINVDPA